jgi:hypothetical protein
MKTVVALVCVMMVAAGCASSGSGKRVAKGTRVCVSVTAPDVLYSGNVVQGSGMAGVTSRIEKHLCKRLDQRGVLNGGESSLHDGDARLVVKLNTIEALTGSVPGPFFTAVAYRKIQIKYSAALTSKEGTVVEFEGEQTDESLDKLAQKVGEDVGNRAAGHCDR